MGNPLSILPPQIPNQTADMTAPPQIDDSAAGLSGLGGQPLTVSGPASPVVAGPATHESVARHILDALSGTHSDDKLGWAKSVLSGALAGAANVGEAPHGAGALYGASRAALGVQELQRQKMLDQQRLKQQAFENQLKTKQDIRAEQELTNATDRTKAEIALWNTKNIAAVHEEQQNQLMRPYLLGEAKDKFEALETAKQTARADFKKVLIESGVKPEELEKAYSTYDDAPSGAAQNIGNNNLMLAHNGEKPSADEDNVGLHAIANPAKIWDTPIESDKKVLSGYEFNPKTNSFTPQYTTASKGTTYGTLFAMHTAAMDYLQQQENQVSKQAQLEHEKAGTQSELASAAHARAETAKTLEETKQLKEWDIGGEKKDSFGNPVGAPGMDKKEYVKRVDSYNKDYSKDLNQLDAARSQLTDIIHNAETTGKLPGADAVVGIFDAIGLSSAPLKGRGFRINNQVVGEHVEGTRNAWQGAALKLSRLTPEGTGQIVSLQQLKDYQRIMDQARHDAYVGAANDAVNRGIGVQTAPRGNGKPVDANTMDIFLTMAHGDPKTASAIAKQYGWTPPQ